MRAAEAHLRGCFARSRGTAGRVWEAGPRLRTRASRGQGGGIAGARPRMASRARGGTRATGAGCPERGSSRGSPPRWISWTPPAPAPAAGGPACRIGQAMGLPDAEVETLMLSGLFMTSGPFPRRARGADGLEEPAGGAPGGRDHCEVGYQLLRGFEPLRSAARVIRFHHVGWRDAARVTAGASRSPRRATSCTWLTASPSSSAPARTRPTRSPGEQADQVAARGSLRSGSGGCASGRRCSGRLLARDRGFRRGGLLADGWREAPPMRSSSGVRPAVLPARRFRSRLTSTHASRGGRAVPGHRRALRASRSARRGPRGGGLPARPREGFHARRILGEAGRADARAVRPGQGAQL